MEVGECLFAADLGGEKPGCGCWGGCWGRGGVSAMLLGGTFRGIMFPILFALVIEEGILWVGARVEVG